MNSTDESTALSTAISHACAERKGFDHLDSATQPNAQLVTKPDPTITVIQQICKQVGSVTAALQTKAAKTEPWQATYFHCGKPVHFAVEGCLNLASNSGTLLLHIQDQNATDATRVDM